LFCDQLLYDQRFIFMTTMLRDDVINMMSTAPDNKVVELRGYPNGLLAYSKLFKNRSDFKKSKEAAKAKTTED
jgi:hypothetical protein